MLPKGARQVPSALEQVRAAGRRSRHRVSSHTHLVNSSWCQIPPERPPSGQGLFCVSLGPVSHAWPAGGPAGVPGRSPEGELTPPRVSAPGLSVHPSSSRPHPHNQLPSPRPVWVLCIALEFTPLLVLFPLFPNTVLCSTLVSLLCSSEALITLASGAHRLPHSAQSACVGAA